MGRTQLGTPVAPVGTPSIGRIAAFPVGVRQPTSDRVKPRLAYPGLLNVEELSRSMTQPRPEPLSLTP